MLIIVMPSLPLFQILVRGYEQSDCDQDFEEYSFVAYPFQPSSSRSAKCMVKLTGFDSLLECIDTVGRDRRRTSAAYSGAYAHYAVKEVGAGC